MKKVCLITMGNLYTVPYIEMYRSIMGNSFDIIYWNRENRNETIDCNNIEVFNYDINGESILRKIIGYFKYRKFIFKCIKHTKYDKVILLQTWCALLLYGIIDKLYYNRYVVDIRDYTYEYNPIIRLIENKVLKKAEMRLISSEGFKQFLPKGLSYHIIHNIREIDQNEKNEIICRSHKREPINISFIGVVNYIDNSRLILESLGNDKRFHVSFIGTNAMKLKEFCDLKEIKNVTLVDTFKPDEILYYYKKADIINNLYGHNDPRLDYALSNKLYFSAQLKMPILVFSDTYMSEISKKYSMGLEVNCIDDRLGDNLYSKYISIKWEDLFSGCDALLKKIQIEQNDTIERLTKAMK